LFKIAAVIVSVVCCRAMTAGNQLIHIAWPSCNKTIRTLTIPAKAGIEAGMRVLRMMASLLIPSTCSVHSRNNRTTGVKVLEKKNIANIKFEHSITCS